MASASIWHWAIFIPVSVMWKRARATNTFSIWCYIPFLHNHPTMHRKPSSLVFPLCLDVVHNVWDDLLMVFHVNIIKEHVVQMATTERGLIRGDKSTSGHKGRRSFLSFVQIHINLIRKSHNMRIHIYYRLNFITFTSAIHSYNNKIYNFCTCYCLISREIADINY